MKNNKFYNNIIKMYSSATKEYIADDTSSEQIFNVSFFDKLLDVETSSVSESDCLNESNNVFSRVDLSIARRIALNDEIKRDELINKLIVDLEKELDLFDDESEEYSSAERKIIEIEHKYNMRVLGEVIQNIYVRHFDNPLYLCGICRALLRYDLDEAKPWGAAMLTGLLNHSDDRVKEYTIQLIDNWCDVELLPILKALQVSTDWLRDYIMDVVDRLENENVLYQKII